MHRGMIIIPISKVSFGFAAGGSEFTGETVNEYSKKEKEEIVQYRLPFGGGAGAGASINPVAFLVVQNGTARIMPVENSSCIDRLMEYVPDLMERVNKMFKQKTEHQGEKVSDKFELKHRINTNIDDEINYKQKAQEAESDGEDF